MSDDGVCTLREAIGAANTDTAIRAGGAAALRAGRTIGIRNGFEVGSGGASTLERDPDPQHRTREMEGPIQE